MTNFFKKNINWILVIFLFLGSVFFKKNTSILIPTLISTSTPMPILTSKQIQNQTFYLISKVVDGDTIEIEIDGKIQRIRVIGINTPEVIDPRKPVECFGKEASEKAKELLSGKKVRLEKDPTQGDIDKYARLLRYVFLEDGTDFGLTMIKEGYAYEYTYKIPYKYQQQYKQAQKEAEKNKKGLWADNACITPMFLNFNSYSTDGININKEISKINLECEYSCIGSDKDCSDFKTQQEAQVFFDCCGFSAANDPMNLDDIGIGDGIVCESLN